MSDSWCGVLNAKSLLNEGQNNRVLRPFQGKICYYLISERHKFPNVARNNFSDIALVWESNFLPINEGETKKPSVSDPHTGKPSRCKSES